MYIEMYIVNHIVYSNVMRQFRQFDVQNQHLMENINSTWRVEMLDMAWRIIRQWVSKYSTVCVEMFDNECRNQRHDMLDYSTLCVEIYDNECPIIRQCMSKCQRMNVEIYDNECPIIRRCVSKYSTQIVVSTVYKELISYCKGSTDTFILYK